MLILRMFIRYGKYFLHVVVAQKGKKRNSCFYIASSFSYRFNKMGISEELEDILKSAKADGLSRSDLQDVLGLVDHGQEKRRSKTTNIISLLVVLVAIVWGGIFGFKGPKSLRADLEDNLNNATICLVDNSAPTMEFSRPLSNCTAMCAGLKEVARLETITQKQFIEEYAYTGRPLVVTGMTKNWTAFKTFNFNYLKKLYNSYEDAYDVQDQSCQFFGYKTKFQSLEEVFLMSKRRSALKGKRWYIGWSNCHTKVMAEIRKHYQKPEFLPSDSETSQQDWIFMGGAGPGAPVHIDSVDRPSWQAQISGKKSWAIIPPAECESVCHPLNITMNRGDVVVIDTNQWFHSTYIHAGDISITVGAEYD